MAGQQGEIAGRNAAALGVVVVGAGLEVALTRTFPALFRLYVQLAGGGGARGVCGLCCARLAGTLADLGLCLPHLCVAFRLVLCLMCLRATPPACLPACLPT
jgi:hypothetical protein